MTQPSASQRCFSLEDATNYVVKTLRSMHELEEIDRERARLMAVIAAKRIGGRVSDEKNELGITLDLGHCQVTWFKKYEDEDTWGGTVHFFGYPHHFMAVKVVLVEVGEHAGEWLGTNDPHNRLDDYYHLYDYPPMPAKIPGLEGDFVILVHPHGK